MNPYSLYEKVKSLKPVVHHLTNWVTIYDCAGIVKTFGASPVMAHAPEEMEDMTSIASALVLNIGTLTVDFIEAMKKAGKTANKKGIPIILDVCGAGATHLRDEKCFELLNTLKIGVIKGNSSEISRMAGENVKTQGVDSTDTGLNPVKIARKLADQRQCTVVMTGATDIVTGAGKTLLIKNGHPLMSAVVGTGCMAASVIGTFAAVEKDLVAASACGLVCFEVAAEIAAEKSRGPGTFKTGLYDEIYLLQREDIEKRQKIESLS